MKFFIDTGILLRAGLTLSPKKLAVFLDQAHEEGVTIVTTKLVVEESVNKFRERIEKESGNANKALRELSNATRQRLLGGVSTTMIDAWCDEYRYMIEQLFEDVDGKSQIRDYPLVSHEDIAQRAVTGRKPYNKGEKDSYRDTLIWHAFIEEVLADPEEKVCLVTTNTDDFCEKSGNSFFLHRELIEEIRKTGNISLNIDVLTSIDMVVERNWHEKIMAVARLEEELKVDRKRLEEFKGDIESVIEMALENSSSVYADALGSDVFDDLDFVGVDLVEIMDFTSASATITDLAHGVVLQAGVNSHCRVNVIVFERDEIETGGLAVSKIDESSGEYEGVFDFVLPCTVSIFYSPTWEVVSSAISVGDFGTWELVQSDW